MVARLAMGGRSLTEEEVLFRHQLLKLIQREKVKRSLHRSFAPGGLFGGTETLNIYQTASDPRVSNPLYDSARSPPRGSAAAVPAKKENADRLKEEGGNAVLSRQSSRSKTGRSSRSLLQLMKQSHGSLKQLLSKEGMEDGAAEGTEGLPGTCNWKRAKKELADDEEAPLVSEELQSPSEIPACGNSRQIGGDETKDVKPVLKPVKHSRTSSPLKSIKVCPASIDPLSAAEPPVDAAELVKQQVGADVSLQSSPRKDLENCPSKDLQNSPRNGSGRRAFSLYSEENLQEKFFVFMDITLKDGILPGQDHKRADREQESAEMQDESLTKKVAHLSMEGSSFSEAINSDSCSATEEKDSQGYGLKNKRKSKSGCSTPSTPSKPGTLKLPFSGSRCAEDSDEPLSHQMVHADSEPEPGHPDAADFEKSRHTGGTTNSTGRTKKSRPRPLKRLFTSTMMCRCDVGSSIT